jgi:ureidoacrylate peracid hydrolase
MKERSKSVPLKLNPNELLEKVDLMNSAVLVVDIQNDWDHEGGARAKAGNDVSIFQNTVPRIEAFLKGARSYHVPIIHIRSTHDKWTDSPPWLARFCKRNIDACNFLRPGSWGAEFYKVIPQADDYIVTKHRYSAFVDTELDLVLRCTGIKTIIMAGFATDICVQNTALHGFMRDYYVVVLADCTATLNPEDHVIALGYMDKLSLVITNAETLLEAWRIGGEG